MGLNGDSKNRGKKNTASLLVVKRRHSIMRHRMAQHHTSRHVTKYGKHATAPYGRAQHPAFTAVLNPL